MGQDRKRLRKLCSRSKAPLAPGEAGVSPDQAQRRADSNRACPMQEAPSQGRSFHAVAISLESRTIVRRDSSDIASA